MSQENVEVIRSVYAAWERGDFGSAQWAHPDIEFVVADSFEAGSWMGRAGMAQAWCDWVGAAGWMAQAGSAWMSAWEEYRVEVDEYRRLDDERILVLMLHCGRGKTSGLDVRQTGTKKPGANVLHVRDGRVTRILLYWDRERALADLGISE